MIPLKVRYDLSRRTLAGVEASFHYNEDYCSPSILPEPGASGAKGSVVNPTADLGPLPEPEAPPPAPPVIAPVPLAPDPVVAPPVGHPPRVRYYYDTLGWGYPIDDRGNTIRKPTRPMASTPMRGPTQ